MGLDFSHGDAYWSYSSFNRFRERLAQTAGFNLREMQGFDGRKSWDNIKDPIKGLLNHSDCDGALTETQCKAIIPRLKELITFWDEEDYDKRKALRLIDGIEEAMKKNEEFYFC